MMYIYRSNLGKYTIFSILWVVPWTDMNVYEMGFWVYDIWYYIYYIYIYFFFSILWLVFNPGYPYKGPFGSFLVGWSDLFANPKRLVVFPEEFRWYQRLRWSMQAGMPKTQYFLGLGGFLQWWYPQNIPKWSFLVGKRMVVGYHHFRKPPGGDNSFFFVHAENWGRWTHFDFCICFRWVGEKQPPTI